MNPQISSPTIFNSYMDGHWNFIDMCKILTRNMNTHLQKKKNYAFYLKLQIETVFLRSPASLRWAIAMGWWLCVVL